jgi:hypothetical protein
MRRLLCCPRMRGPAFGVFACSLCVTLGGCRANPSTHHRADADAPVPSASVGVSASRDAITAVERELQATKLMPPPRRRHLPRLAFGAGALGRLRDDDVQVLDSLILAELALIPLEQPRAVVAMADGALVAVGSGGVVRWERGKRVAPPGARFVLFPGAELYPDARQSDLLWVLEPDSAPPKLNGYRLGVGALSGVLMPELVIELKSPRGGTFGVTREGVWLYHTANRVERLAPSGLQLPGLSGGLPVAPGWSLPARRVDQSLFVDDAGTLTRALVSPVFKSLAAARAAGKTYAADVGDAGRLLAIVSVTGAGPRFELALFDSELLERGRALLPAESPTGERDWIRTVTRNQELAVAPQDARVAVGGPDRLTIYDGAANVTLSIPIR